VVRAAPPGWPLVIVGDGPDRAALEQQAREAGRPVRFEGWIDRGEVLRWTRHATLLVFPSYGPESLSRVLLEAGALGVPIAAMETGGTRDIIRPGETGLLSRTADDLAADVARLAQDAPLRARLGSAAADHVAAAFDAAAVTSRIDALYLELLGTRAGRARPARSPE
jgi:glycosyltransferase involved in cell wall biosynthesis